MPVGGDTVLARTGVHEQAQQHLSELPCSLTLSSHSKTTTQRPQAEGPQKLSCLLRTGR